MNIECFLGIIRKLVLYFNVAEPANWFWSIIYPYTTLRKKRDVALQQLLTTLVRPGDLVFDIGANKGLYTELFLFMQAREVIAVEPNIKLIKKLIRPNVRVLNVALGSYNEFVDYYIGEIDGLSTLSQEYMNLSRNSVYKWKSPHTVYVTTLDYLASVYGIPDFVKIDVEGYEKEVIAGMNFAPKALSFEFIPENIGSVIQCTNKLDKLRSYQYTYTIGLEPGMQFEMQLDTADELINQITTRVPKDAFGDIWAKR